LVSFISLDSCKRESRRRNQLIRRIGFGTLTTGFFVAGLYYNLKTHDAVDRVKNAYNSYQQLNSSNMLEEFTTAHDQVEAEKKKADLYCQKRNVCYALAAVFCAGLSISIKF
jgi:hypothetical protein